MAFVAVLDPPLVEVFVDKLAQVGVSAEDLPNNLVAIIFQHLIVVYVLPQYSDLLVVFGILDPLQDLSKSLLVHDRSRVLAFLSGSCTSMSVCLDWRLRNVVLVLENT